MASKNTRIETTDATIAVVLVSDEDSPLELDEFEPATVVVPVVVVGIVAVVEVVVVTNSLVVVDSVVLSILFVVAGNVVACVLDVTCSVVL